MSIGGKFTSPLRGEVAPRWLVGTLWLLLALNPSPQPSPLRGEGMS